MTGTLLEFIGDLRECGQTGELGGAWAPEIAQQNSCVREQYHTTKSTCMWIKSFARCSLSNRRTISITPSRKDAGEHGPGPRSHHRCKHQATAAARIRQGADSEHACTHRDPPYFVAPEVIVHTRDHTSSRGHERGRARRKKKKKKTAAKPPRVLCAPSLCTAATKASAT